MTYTNKANSKDGNEHEETQNNELTIKGYLF